MSSALPVLPSRELVLDRYRPLRPLGSGASGSVWLARDERTGLEVALKIVPREGKAAHRAEREAEAAARLRHERCLRSYGFGADAGHVYIAYEYVGGRTLREAMRAGELTDARAVEAAAQILEGLAHAHGRGIVHRDVKPSNVLLLDEEHVSIRVLDFGLARFDEAETLTAVGDVPGTLAYISPERLAGEEAGPASDVWGVGILLWEALAGKHPFWGTPLQQMTTAIESGAPPLAAERRDLPQRLLGAIDRALAPDPARRPSASALAHELREAAAGKRRKSRPKRLGASNVTRPQSVMASKIPRGGTTHSPFAASTLAARALPAFAAGLATLVGASFLPFFPAGWAMALAFAAAVGTVVRARAGLALALATPILPLGNLSLGLALLYGALAAGWLALAWRDPRSALSFLAGPLLAPLGLIALVPLTVQPARGSVRRAFQAVAAVGVAALAAGMRGASLPFGETAPTPELAGLESPVEAARVLLETMPAAIGLEALALAAVAVAIPWATSLWRIAGLGAVMLAATLLLAPSAAPLPLLVAVWLTCAALAWRHEH
ncbi:MAG: serine/threonine protein kinase [Gaiellaceae bacterium MAG52_C11]|nr:serine/threonine protein kinase [Candidatus Gaiellasilicea maunaloa]